MQFTQHVYVFQSILWYLFLPIESSKKYEISVGVQRKLNFDGIFHVFFFSFYPLPFKCYSSTFLQTKWQRNGFKLLQSICWRNHHGLVSTPSFALEWVEYRGKLANRKSTAFSSGEKRKVYVENSFMFNLTSWTCFTGFKLLLYSTLNGNEVGKESIRVGNSWLIKLYEARCSSNQHKSFC